MKQFQRLGLLLTAACVLLVTAPAGAVDGVKLIKQPKSFPIVISTPGSYRLRKNITVPDENTTAINITADDVTLDLNGFSIIGPTVCSGDPVTSCAPTGSGRGIVSAVGTANTTILNGTVRGMGDDGIALLGPSARFERLRVVSNAGHGIDFEDDVCVIRDSVVSSNGAAGIHFIANYCAVTGNVVSSNHGDGINAYDGSVVSGNTVRSNGAEGVIASQGSLVIGNIIGSNVDGGFDINTDVGYAGNVLTGNNHGMEQQVFGGTQIGGNVCGSDTTCP
jgi:parallel beta-helix repeat protein